MGITRMIPAFIPIILLFASIACDSRLDGTGNSPDGSSGGEGKYGLPEINTNASAEVKHYYQLWKAKLLNQSGMSDEYFKEHFIVEWAEIRIDPQHNSNSFWIRYGFIFKWVNITHTDEYIVSKDGMPFSDEDFQTGISTAFSHPVISVISPSQNRDLIERCFKEQGIQATSSNLDHPPFFNDTAIWREGPYLYSAFPVTQTPSELYYTVSVHHPPGCLHVNVKLETGDASCEQSQLPCDLQY